MTKDRLATLLSRVQGEAAALHIPFAPSLKVRVNTRAVRRLGCCIREQGTFTLELSAALLQQPDDEICETLAHELLHTCYGCQNHGKRWKSYAAKMNAAYGYHIARTGKAPAAPVRPAPYRLRCANCGAELLRYRRSPLVDHPERYRCRCGGALRRMDPP